MDELDELDFYNEDGEGDELNIKQGVNEYTHMYNESDINIKNYGLAEIDMNNPHAMKTVRRIDGEEKFFLRLMIYAYTYLKYKENIVLQKHDFDKIMSIIHPLPYYTKKSPLGLLLSYYMFDKNKFINMVKFKSVMKINDGNIKANSVVPMNYMYKVYASDLIRYVKLYHEIGL